MCVFEPSWTEEGTEPEPPTSCAFSLIAFLFYEKGSEFWGVNYNSISKEKCNPRSAIDRNGLSSKVQHRFYGSDSELEVEHICFRHNMDTDRFLT